MENAALFTTALLVGFSGAMMPGPMLTITIGGSLKRGAIVGAVVVLGHAILELILVLGLLLGLSQLLASSSVIKTIGILGGSMLSWMGLGMLREARTASLVLTTEKASGNSSNVQTALSAAVVSLSNPYWVLWWATVGASYLTLAWHNGPRGVAAFFSGHILADFLWYTLISLSVASGKKFLGDPIYRMLLAVFAVFLVALGVYFIYSGVTMGSGV